MTYATSGAGTTSHLSATYLINVLADFKEKIASQAMVAAAGATPRQLADYMKSEVQLWNRIVKTTGAKPDYQVTHSTEERCR